MKMELVNSKKVDEQIFCEVCEKDRKHVINTYQGLNNNNEVYTVDYQKCKACGKERELM